MFDEALMKVDLVNENYLIFLIKARKETFSSFVNLNLNRIFVNLNRMYCQIESIINLNPILA